MRNIVAVKNLAVPIDVIYVCDHTTIRHAAKLAVLHPAASADARTSVLRRAGLTCLLWCAITERRLLGLD